MHFLHVCMKSAHTKKAMSTQIHKLCMACRRRQPDWWRLVAYSGTKLLYQPEPKPVVYIVPVKNILGRLALVPYGEHGTIPYDWHALQRSHYAAFSLSSRGV